jgi:vitamin B12 transporter
MRSWKICVAAIMLPIYGLTQEAEELKEVVVSGNRIELPISETSRSVVILTQKEIAALPVQNLNELIQSVAGVDVRQRGAYGMQGDVSTRGGTFEQTLILLNGIKMNDPQTGHHNLNIGVDIANIERIEIIKGPAASRYGLNSFSGVINIVTKPSTENTARINMAAMQSASGDFLTEANSGYAIGASADFGKEKWRNQIQVNRTQSNGYRANTDFVRQQLMYQTNLKTKVGEFGAIATYLDNAFGASGFYAFPIDSSSYEIVRTGMIALTHEKNFGKIRWTSKVYWRNNYDEYTLFRLAPSIFQNKHTTNTVGGETHATYSYKYGKIGFGAEVRNENIRSTNLGEFNRLNLGVFAENRTWLLKNRLNIGQGIYINQSSDFGMQYLPSIDANYKFSETVSVFGNVGTSFRIPSFTDLYYQGPINEGNPDLDPEKAISYELGAKWNSSEHQLQTSVFLQEAEGLIDWVRASDLDTWQPRNYENTTTSGIEVNYKWTNSNNNSMPFKWSQVSLGYTYLDIALNQNNDLLSRYALSHLNHQLTARVTASVFEKLSLSVVGRYFDRINYKSYLLLESRIAYKLGKNEIYLDGNNLLNTEYIEAAQAPMPGRWLRLGANIVLK